MTWVEGQNRAFFTLVKIVRCDVRYRTVDFGAPIFFYVEFMYCSYVQFAYVPTKKYDLFPAGTDLAVKLLTKFQKYY